MKPTTIFSLSVVLSLSELLVLSELLSSLELLLSLELISSVVKGIKVKPLSLAYVSAVYGDADDGDHHIINLIVCKFQFSFFTVISNIHTVINTNNGLYLIWLFDCLIRYIFTCSSPFHQFLFVFLN